MPKDLYEDVVIPIDEIVDYVRFDYEEAMQTLHFTYIPIYRNVVIRSRP